LHANAKAIGLCFVQLFTSAQARAGIDKMPHLKLLHTYSTKSGTFTETKGSRVAASAVWHQACKEHLLAVSDAKACCQKFACQV
jgi:hypothetical protein